MKYFKDVIKGYDNLNTKEITKESLKLEVKSIAYNSKRKIIYLLPLKA